MAPNGCQPESANPCEKCTESTCEVCFASIKSDLVDMINAPPHYTAHKWEAIDIMDEFFPDDSLLFTVLKYLLRCKYKNSFLEDLKKARWYLDRRIAKEEGKNEN